MAANWPPDAAPRLSFVAIKDFRGSHTAVAHDDPSQPTVNISTQRWNFALTAFVEMSTLVSGFLTLRLAALALGTVRFGEYAVARRGVAVIAFPMLLGLGISVPRYVARTPDRTTLRRAYLIGAMLIAAPILFVTAAGALAFPARVATWFYGDAAFGHLVPGIVVCVAGLCLHTIMYAYLRGLLSMITANALQFLNFVLVPPIAMVVGDGRVSAVLALTGAAWFATSSMVAAAIFVSAAQWPDRRAVRDCAGELVRFGLPRLPGEFALFGLMAVPTFIVSSRLGVEQAGFFSFGLSLLQLVGSLFSALGILLLPYVSRLVATRQWTAIDQLVRKILWASLAIAAVVVGVLEAGLQPLIGSWMGYSFVRATVVARQMLLAAIPYTVYVVLRNPLDALSVWPHNSINVSVTLVIAVSLMWFGERWVTSGTAMLIALTTLGLLSAASWWLHLGRVGARELAAAAAELRVGDSVSTALPQS